MIFVTVGNATQGFRRLLEALDHMASQGLFQNEAIVMQSGNNPGFHWRYGMQVDFFSSERFVELIHDASLVISHAGAGTLLQVLRTGKVPVAMPRKQIHGEHIDDHQVELVNVLASEGRVVPAYEASDLPDAIAEARKRNAQPLPSPPTQMLGLIDEAIRELIVSKGRLC
jgi:UDP-N-acetylglucosamine transferase subunit ALG13